jgi:hypothetical protein
MFLAPQVQVIDRETFEHPAPAEPVKAETLKPLDLNSSPAPNDPANTDPRTSSSAPKATDAPKGSEIKVPSAQEVGKKVDESVEKGKQTAKDAEEKGKQVAKDAEAKGKAAARDVEKKAERAADKVEETAKEVKGASKQLARDAEVKGKELVDDAAEKTKEVANDVEKKAKQLKREAKVRAGWSRNCAFSPLLTDCTRVFAMPPGRDPARRERRRSIHRTCQGARPPTGRPRWSDGSSQRRSPRNDRLLRLHPTKRPLGPKLCRRHRRFRPRPLWNRGCRR